MTDWLRAANFAQTTHPSALTSGATSLTVATGDGDLFPSSGQFALTLWNGLTYGTPLQDPAREIVTCSSRSGDVLTIVRGQEGTTAAAHAAGGFVTLAPTAAGRKQLQDAVDTLTVGPASAVDGNLAAFDTATGKLLKDSGSKPADFAAAAHVHTGVYEPANANIQAHIGSTSNPHGVTKAQVSLTNVDDVQQMPMSYLDTDGTLAANSDSKVPSQKAVKTYADGLIAAADAMVYKGALDCSGNPNYPAADCGHTYKVSVAGKIGGASGLAVEVGDTLLCTHDGTASGDQATVGTYWNIIQVNLDGAVIGPASAVDGNFVAFDGVTGKLTKDSGSKAADFATAGLATSSGLTMSAPGLLGRSSSGAGALQEFGYTLGLLQIGTTPETPTGGRLYAQNGIFVMNGGASAQISNRAWNGTASAGPYFSCYRARGSYDSPAVMNDGDLAGAYHFYGLDTGLSTWRQGASIQVKADGSATGSTSPMKFEVYTSGTLRATFNNAGNLMIGTATDGMTAAGSLAVAKDFAHRGSNLGFYNASPTTKQTVSGSRGSNAALASLLTALAAIGLITDSSSA